VSKTDFALKGLLSDMKEGERFLYISNEGNFVIEKMKPREVKHINVTASYFDEFKDFPFIGDKKEEV
jgi:hypothetical protein